VSDRGNPSLLRSALSEALRALRENLVPGLFLQGVMGAIAALYLLNPATRLTFDKLALLRSQWGLLFSFAGTSTASAILPELMRFILCRGRTRREQDPLWERLIFGIPFWGLVGMQVDLFYRLQYRLFGPSDTILVIIKKVLFDSLLYCPLLAVPQAVCVLLWRDHRFTFHGFRGHHPLRFYALKIFPVLVANWMVWIPLICIIYALPCALGVPFFIVAQCFWVMVLTTLASSRSPLSRG